MGTISRVVRAFGTTWLTRSARPPPKVPPVILDTYVIDEEKTLGYNARNFYPARIGETLNERYEIAAKLGYGSFSTVWLARDRLRKWFWQPERYVALKINVNDYENREDAMRELEVARRIDSGNRWHQGRRTLRNALDSFQIQGPDGRHLCLIFEALREPLWLLRRRGVNGKLPLSLVKPMVHFFLLGLDYLHSECHIVHTDLKTDNILIAFESPEVLNDYIEGERENPNPVKEIDGRTIYLSRNDFGFPRETIGEPKICDFGQARFLEAAELQYETIQPGAYRAPEVILGAGWTFSVDIWNLGVMLWDLLETESLFSPSLPDDPKKYEEDLHLAQMIALIGDPPATLLSRGRTTAQYFDSSGKFLSPDLIPEARGLVQALPSLREEPELDMFIRFIKRLLVWLPEERSTAKELLEDPWIMSQ